MRRILFVRPSFQSADALAKHLRAKPNHQNNKSLFNTDFIPYTPASAPLDERTVPPRALLDDIPARAITEI